MKIKESIGREIIALIVTVMAVMFFLSLLMIKRIEYTYQNYVYDTKTDLLNSSIHSVESELEKIENTTYRILTDSDVQREISLWLEAEERLQELGDKPGTSKERLENQKQKADSMRQLIQKVDPVITADQSLVTGFFISPDGYRYNGYGGGALQIPLSLQEEIEKRAKEQDGDLVYLVCWQKNGVLQMGYPGQREENAQTRLVLARTMREKKSLTLAHGGTLILVLDPARLSNGYTTASHKLLIEDPEQGVIFTTLLQAEEQDFLAWEHNPENIKDSRYQILFLNNEKYFVTKLVSSDQHWDYYSISSYEELFGLLDKADVIYIVLFVGMTILLCGAAVHFSMYLVHPIVELSGKMRSIRNSSHVQRDSCEEPLQFLSGPLRTTSLEQIVGPQHDDQQICVGKQVRSGGRDLPAILSHVGDRPSGFRRQDVHPPAVRVVAPAEIATRVIAIGVGVAETDDFHPVCFLSLYICVFQ